MNAPLTPPLRDALADVSLDDKYTLEKGRVYMSGTQALVRLPMLQKARDRRAGLNTAGYVSGYRGSPLGALDQGLWKAKKHLKEHDVVFQPGVNEDLAATAVWGTQQLNLWPGAKVDGVFGMWYGKGPGVDRTGDVFKHANSAGTDPNGGVLVLAGDDHAAKSSSVAHQSEHMFVASGIPVLYPASVQEYLDYGLHGWAMSRYAGLWVAMKCVTDVVESSASIDIDPDRLQIVLPNDFEMPEGGLNIRWPDPPLAQEARLLNYKWYAALAYIRANKLNRVVIDSPNPRLGIMTAGKAYLDVRQALADLSLDDETCARIGIRVLKVGCVWPLDAQNARDFATGLDEILVVEEKRQILEYALKEELYNWRDDVRPKVFGKFDQRDDEGGEWSVPRGQTLLPAHYELSPALIAKAIARRLAKADLPADLQARIDARVAVIEAKEREAATPRSMTERQPWFCSGCPHNTSTRVPEGSRALAGIGCHYMSMWMDRKTETFSQMGGEGVAWTGQMHFTNERHVFVNLGDGTYFHSGLLAIRASIAAGANVTYKVLYNDAVAMTGGQPVDGVLTVPQIAFQVVAEGAKRVLIVTDEPEKYDANIRLPEGVKVYHRDELDRLQRELREMAGTSILIYDQTCATEKRRRRKRGTYPDPAKRAFINDAVCEGCGDCSVQSNCLSVEPLQTPLGTKRKINQSSCNKDFSCVNGFCPSFVTAEGAQVKKPAKPASAAALPDFAALPRPVIASLAKPYGVLVTGVGGTGVVTIGGLLGMAAHLENKGVTVLDMAGLAQKGGAVLSHVQIAAAPDQLHATRIAAGEARLILGCDAIVSASAEVLARTHRGLTKAAINSGATPTAQFVRDPQWSFPADQTQQDLRASIGDDCDFIDANRLALALLGDTLYANPLLLGFVWQRGWLPLSYESLERAIELNDVAVEKNRLAFKWGRYVAQHGEAAVDTFAPPAGKQQAIVVQMPESLDRLIERNVERLSVYQNPRYAARYVEAVERLRAREADVVSGSKPRLTPVVARNLAKLMTYKDEYEVARLYVDPAYMDKLRAQFEGEPGRDYKLAFHLAPPLLAKRDEHGHLKKQRFGQWTLTLFRVLKKFRFLRGTAFDVFGKTEERRNERELIEQYFALVDELCATLDTTRFDAAMKLANLPDEIRGFGHVKERNVLAAATKRERWLAEYRADAAGTPTISSSQPFESVMNPTMHDRDGVIWLDGELVQWRDAQLHFLTHSLHYGMAVFEGVRAYETAAGPAIFRLDDHTKRLFNSAKIFEMAVPFSMETIRDAQLEVVRRNQLAACYLRPLVWLGSEQMGLGARGNTVHVGIAAWPWGSYLGEEGLARGIRVKTSSLSRHHVNVSLVRAKASGYYINSILANREVTRNGYDEALLLDTEGYVSEGAGENVFIVRNGVLYTPDLASCLDGITRASVIEIARDQGLQVVEKRITRDEMYCADEAFFTGTAAEVTPIRELDDRVIGNGERGPITASLQETFFAAVAGKSERYAHWLTRVVR